MDDDEDEQVRPDALLDMLHRFRDCCETKRRELDAQVNSLVEHSALHYGVAESTAASMCEKEVENLNFFRQERNAWHLLSIMLQLHVQNETLAAEISTDPDRWSRSRRISQRRLSNRPSARSPDWCRGH